MDMDLDLVVWIDLLLVLKVSRKHKNAFEVEKVFLITMDNGVQGSLRLFQLIS